VILRWAYKDLNYFHGLVFKKFQGFFFNPSPSACLDNHNCINNVNGEGGMGGHGKIRQNVLTKNPGNLKKHTGIIICAKPR
jgi:hypothetical protein